MTWTDAQVEAAARALCTSLGENPDWQHYYRDARAALEAAALAAPANQQSQEVFFHEEEMRAAAQAAPALGTVSQPRPAYDAMARDALLLENWQMKQALGYPIPAEYETINNPFKCGVCDARALEAAAQAAPAPTAAPEEWVLAPRQLTPEMRQAGRGWDGLDMAWKRMLAAAPPPPTEAKS